MVHINMKVEKFGSRICNQLHLDIHHSGMNDESKKGNSYAKFIALGSRKTVKINWERYSR